MRPGAAGSSYLIWERMDCRSGRTSDVGLQTGVKGRPSAANAILGPRSAVIDGVRALATSAFRSSSEGVMSRSCAMSKMWATRVTLMAPDSIRTSRELNGTGCALARGAETGINATPRARPSHKRLCRCRTVDHGSVRPEGEGIPGHDSGDCSRRLSFVPVPLD